MPANDEETIIEACLGGDIQAYQELVERFHSEVLGLCLSYTGSTATAEDMAQEAFINAYLQLGHLQLPTRTFARSLILRKAGRTIHLLHFGRARTRGDVVVYLPEEKVLVAGALIFAGPGSFKGQVYPASWGRVLAAIDLLDFVAIIPHHDPVFRGRQWLHYQMALYQSLGTQVRQGVEAGWTLDKIRQQVDLKSFRAEAIEGDAHMAQHFDEWVLGNGVEWTYRELTE